jgi:hypothetical protein
MGKVSLRRLNQRDQSIRNELNHYIEVINKQGLAIMHLYKMLTEKGVIAKEGTDNGD